VSATVVKIRPGALGAHIRATSRANRAALKKAVRRASMRGVGLLKKLTPVDEGVARSAWSAKTYSSGWTGIENASPHIGILLKGARPHAVNAEGVAAIREWVIRKGLVQMLQPLKKGHQGPQQAKKLSRSQADGEFSYLVDEVVWAIISKLKKYGYKGDDFVERSMPDLVAYLDTEVAIALAEVAQNPGGES
jgi:hypothetical protein